jgi:hypothetical protein
VCVIKLAGMIVNILLCLSCCSGLAKIVYKKLTNCLFDHYVFCVVLIMHANIYIASVCDCLGGGI